MERKTFFTSDLHLGHANIIRYCNRPFKSVEEMDTALITNWNSLVGPDDDIYVIGDFSMGKTPAPSYLERLMGRKHLIWGNHDSKQVRELPHWASSQPYHEMNIDHRFVVLCHYKFDVFNRSHRGGLQLFGHSHGSMPGNSQQLDVGVDCWNYKPVTFTEILRKLNTLPPYRNADYHGEK